MRPLNNNQSRALAVGLLLASLTAVALLVYIPASMLNRHYDDAISSRKDYLQRYRNIISAEGSIQAALNQAKKSNGRQHFLNNTVAALAASEIQEIAKNLIDANGGKLISMQIAPSKDEGGYRRISVNVQLAGSMEALQQILYTVETMQPYLLVDNISIRSPANTPFRRGAVGDPSDLNVGLDLSGYSLVVDEK